MNFFKEFLVSFVSVFITMRGVEYLKSSIKFFSSNDSWIEFFAFMLVFIPVYLVLTLIFKKLGILKVGG
ncbi:hypothetical protein [Shewanella sp. YIC-542]|uniref:hypothetical protein n=1 Tax=Shewanella mytili TaxID=3377111 RepID=UPI00398EC1C2